MNKTLLLIMCDFMLLNLLALTRWEKAEPTHTQLDTAAPRAAVNAPAVNADMVELMRLSLEDEKATREQLSALRSDVKKWEERIAKLEGMRDRLAGKLAQARRLTPESTAEQASAGLDALNKHRLQHGASGINRGSVSSRSRTKDHQACVLYRTHWRLLNWSWS